jgi:molecular chaperone DnaK (HSP70)
VSATAKLGNNGPYAVIVKVKDAIFNVVAIGGDTLLGGRDFDNALMDYFVDIIEKKYKKKISENVKIMQRLLKECIDLKHMLTATEDTK